MRAHNTAIDRRITRLTAEGDAAGAAAWSLRHRGICPLCHGRATVTAENAVTGRRHFRCLDCQWSAEIGEPAYRGRADVGLRGICAAAIEIAATADATRGTRRRYRARGAGSRTRRRANVGTENRTEPADVQPGSEPDTRAGHPPRPG